MCYIRDKKHEKHNFLILKVLMYAIKRLKSAGNKFVVRLINGSLKYGNRILERKPKNNKSCTRSRKFPMKNIKEPASTKKQNWG